jgi:SAM-dependent methyltransferase
MAAGTEMVEVGACPACGEGKASVLADKVPGFSLTSSGIAFDQVDFKLLECDACGLVYKTPRPSDAELDRFYATIRFEDWEKGVLYPTDERIIEILKGLPDGARILDFGCSIARVSSLFANRCEVTGFEPNKPSAEIARGRGLTVVDSMDALKQMGPVFDAILLMDVFEHLGEPRELPATLASLLAPGGRLVILTGDGDAPEFRKSPADFWYFQLFGHLCCLTRRHIDHLAKQLSLAVDSVTEHCHYRHPLKELLRQKARRFAYCAHRRDASVGQRLISRLPVIRRAARWRNAPAFTCTVDHVVIVLRRPDSTK